MNLYLGLIGWLLFFVMCGIFWIAYKEAYEEEKVRQEAARHNNRKDAKNG